jgi:predicted transglutaminase-like protease
MDNNNEYEMETNKLKATFGVENFNVDMELSKALLCLTIQYKKAYDIIGKREASSIALPHLSIQELKNLRDTIDHNIKFMEKADNISIRAKKESA